MVLRENEVREWLKDQKSLLESQHNEKGVPRINAGIPNLQIHNFVKEEKKK